MKISIKTDGKKFLILLPTAALPLIFRIAARTSALGESEKELCRALSHTFHRDMRRRYRGLELLHVLSSTGDEVVVRL